MPTNLSSIGEAMTAFMKVLGSTRESLRKILLQGEFDEYPESEIMHATARLAEILDEFSKELRSAKSVDDGEFLVDEMKALEESRSVGLRNFIPKSAFRTLLAKMVKEITAKPFDCAERTWSYIETVVISVLRQHCENYPQLISCTRRASQNLIARKKEQSAEWISDLVEMEKVTYYTCSPEYTASWNKLAHLWGVGAEVLQALYDLKMRMEAYWEVATRSMVDNMVLHLQFSLEKMVNRVLQKEIIEY